MRFVRHEIDAPDPGDLEPGQVHLRFLSGGICGSDLPRCRNAVLDESPGAYGRSLHEVLGEVVASRSDLEIGQRVVGWATKQRGLREVMTCSADSLAPVPDDLPSGPAVALQPLACVLGALTRLPDLHGARAAVIGLGPIGLWFAHALPRAVTAHLFSSLNGVSESPHLFQFDCFGEAEGDLMDKSLADGTDVVMGRRLWEEWSRYWPSNTDDGFGDFINQTRHQAHHDPPEATPRSETASPPPTKIPPGGNPRNRGAGQGPPVYQLRRARQATAP